MSATIKKPATDVSAQPHDAKGPILPAKVLMDPEAVSRAARALYLLVFVAGGILMGVEIAGSRVLAPSFGTSIFVWGSLIGLFMGAMALGYYFGGMLADKYPSFPMLATVVSSAGLFIFLIIPYVGPAICEGIALSVSHKALGPLFASFVLFFIPSFLIAMVSPYAVKLKAESLSGLGGVAGWLYSLSTAGSIVGTLVTTFLLIPMMRVSSVLQGLGLALIVVAIVSLLLFKRAMGGLSKQDRHGTAFMILVALACAEGWLIYPVKANAAPGERLLTYRESTYHDIAVTETVIDVNGYNGPKNMLIPVAEIKRVLKFNENWESATYPYEEKYQNAVGYTNLLHLPLIWNRSPKRMLVIGGGGAITPVQYLSHYKSMQEVDILELDQEVQDTAEKYFQVQEVLEQCRKEDPKKSLRFHIGDARINLKKMDGLYDVIILDAYSSGGQIPFHLLTWEFLRAVREKLSPEGVLATNLIAGLENDDPPVERPADLFLAEYKTLRASEADVKHLSTPTSAQKEPLFSHLYVFPKIHWQEGKIKGREEMYRNVIILAPRNEEKTKTIEEVGEAARQLTAGDDPQVKIKGETYVWDAEHLYDREPKAEALNGVPVLEDDFAPVDTMYRRVKHDESTVTYYPNWKR